MSIDTQAVTQHHISSSHWHGVAALRANELGIRVTHGDLTKIAQAMVRIVRSTQTIPDLDVVIRMHADPTATEAIRSVMKEQNRANAARRISSQAGVASFRGAVAR